MLFCFLEVFCELFELAKLFELDELFELLLQVFRVCEAFTALKSSQVFTAFASEQPINLLRLLKLLTL